MRDTVPGSWNTLVNKKANISASMELTDELRLGPEGDRQ